MKMRSVLYCCLGLVCAASIFVLAVGCNSSGKSPKTSQASPPASSKVAFDQDRSDRLTELFRDPTIEITNESLNGRNEKASAFMDCCMQDIDWIRHHWYKRARYDPANITTSQAACLKKCWLTYNDQMQQFDLDLIEILHGLCRSPCTIMGDINFCCANDWLIINSFLWQVRYDAIDTEYTNCINACMTGP